MPEGQGTGIVGKGSAAIWPTDSSSVTLVENENPEIGMMIKQTTASTPTPR